MFKTKSSGNSGNVMGVETSISPS